MSKPVLITAQETASWISCKSIESNILSAYKYNLSSFDTLTVVLSSGSFSYMQIAEKIVKNRYSKVVVVDYRIDPVLLAIEVSRNKKSKTNINFIVHIYGDFTLNLHWWKKVDQVPSYIQFRFIAASASQKNVVENLLGIREQERVAWIPFPVNTKQYFFKNIKVESVLTKYNIPKNRQLFVYAGRISDQKNVLEMIHYFNEYNRCIGNSACLVLCGPVDDLGVPYLGKLPVPLSYANKFAQVIDDKNVIYLGNRTQKELADLYRCATYYISLSTHNDEDYGMSPAEALCCGTPCILSSWGGYRSFADLMSDAVTTIPVEKVSGRYNTTVKKTLVKLLSLPIKIISKKEISLKACKILGHNEIGKRYVEFLKKNTKFEPIKLPKDSEVVIEGIANNFHKTFIKANVEVTYNELYHKIYRGYYE